jgi:hypothetical protein
MRVKTPAPTFYKGDLVRPVQVTHGWRRMNAEENRSWYEKFHEDCRNGKDTWHDSAGESRLAPSDTFFTLTPEMTLTVLRGRASAPVGYGTMTDCALVFCPDNGQTLFVSRHNLTGRW